MTDLPMLISGLFNSPLITNFHKAGMLINIGLFLIYLTINKIKSYDINIP
jgi:hypothetical protein